jgi:hypothetical protein
MIDDSGGGSVTGGTSGGQTDSESFEAQPVRSQRLDRRFAYAVSERI